MIKIKIILGSTRPNRFSEHAGAWIDHLARARGDMEVELLDLRDYQLPFYNEPISPSYILGEYPNGDVEKWAKKIREADGFIWVTPEYNRGTSAVLKNALDSVYKEWNNKAVACVGYGSVGGARAIEQLRSNAVELQMLPCRNGVHIFAPWTLVDDENKLKPGVLDAYTESAITMLNNLAFSTSTMKAAREKIPEKK